MSRLRPALFALFAILVSLVWAAPASAHMGAERFRVEKRASVPPSGPRGQLALESLTGGTDVRLTRSDGLDYHGVFEVKNTGPGPLLVNRVFLLDAEDDPRAPAGITVQPEKQTRAAIPPGGSRRFHVTWHPTDPRVQEVVANLVVDTDAAQPGATVVDPPKLIGVVARRRSALASHLASLVVVLPLAALLLAALSMIFSALDPRRLRALAGVVLGVETVAALWLFFSFDRELGKRDGNEGLQLIERMVIDGKSGIEIYLGVDGLSVGAIVAVSVVGLAAVLASDPAATATRRHVAAAALALSGTMLALVAQTSLLFTLGWGVAGMGGALMALSVSRRAALRVALAAALSTALVFAWSRFMATHAGTVYLFDGTESDRVYGFPDLARAHWLGVEGSWLGLPAYRAVWLVGFLGCAIQLPLPPLMGWLSGLVAPDRNAGSAAREPSAEGWSALVASLLPALAGYGLVRMILITPDGARWGSESLPAIGAILAVLGGLFALGERDLLRVGVHLSLARAGLLLFVAFSLTPEGLSSASGLVASFAIGAGTFYLAAGRVASVAGESSLNRLTGLGRSAPLLGAAIVLGAAALSGLVLPGFLGPLLGVTGSFGRNPLVTITGTLGLGLVALALARTARVAFGDPPRALESSKQLEPFGGVVPDLRRDDALAWTVIAAFVLLLAVAPRSFVGAADQMIRDVFPRLDPEGPTRVARSKPDAPSSADALPLPASGTSVEAWHSSRSPT